ncbi:hypothetical protein JXA63_05170 [Candidatus Woesebacteria bacterium]|nr:hypothetical protein [Candidatus Woesebacteria bacterium]
MKSKFRSLRIKELNVDKGFLFLGLWFLILRLLPIWMDKFPFNYDNAKDSLAIMQMWTFRKPALLGAVTSMEGLYNGPLWYYIFFPLNLILNFHPIASVLTVNLVGIITLWLVWRYIGKFEAFMMTVSLSVITIMQTAWYPYLTFFPVTWVYIIFTKLNKKKPSTLLLMLLAISVSTMFHAQIAIGVLFVVLVPVILLLNMIVPSKKQAVLMIVGFLLGFMPQLIFEFRHDFLQTRSVYRFIRNFGSEAAEIGQNVKGLGRVLEVLKYYSNNFIGSITPYPLSANKILPAIFILVFVYITIKRFDTFRKEKSVKVIIQIILGSMILHLILPVKFYYLIAYTPLWIFLFSKLIKTYPKAVKTFVVFIFVGISIFHLRTMLINYNNLSKESRILFEPKLKAVREVYGLSVGEAFSSYHYVPELYDYTYQFIYQYLSASEGKRFPVDYAYAPNVPPYMITKKLKGDNVQPSFTMLIVEEDERWELYDRWFNDVTQGKKVVQTCKVNGQIDLYKLVDENLN